MKRTETTVKVGPRRLKLSNLEKVLYPAGGFTKGQVLDYYHRIAPVLLPHLRDHPVTLKRYPGGVSEEFFYEKRCPSFHPDWIQTKQVPSDGPELNYCLLNDEPSLLWAANLAAIELHTLLFLAEDISRPTAMVFDLDPGPPAGILHCIDVALELRDFLTGLGLKSFAKTSGGKGLHFYVPLNTPATFDQTKSFSRALAQAFEQRHEDSVVSKMSKALRKGKVFIDWSQNDEHKTTVCAYSLRARDEPTVSTPVAWEELRKAQRRGSAEDLVFLPEAAVRRAEKLGDLFEPVLKLRQKLPTLQGSQDSL